jgi:hypothetical protein
MPLLWGVNRPYFENSGNLGRYTPKKKIRRKPQRGKSVLATRRRHNSINCFKAIGFEMKSVSKGEPWYSVDRQGLKIWGKNTPSGMGPTLKWGTTKIKAS